MKTEKDRMNSAIELMKSYFAEPRFEGIQRIYSARQVAEQQGTIFNDYSIAKENASAFYSRLKELFKQKRQITTFGPYTPSQAVMMKRAGIEGIYLGGWATSAKGSIDEDPGADLASYPLSQVPNEAAGIVRALVTADRNQTFQRFKMSEEERAVTKEIDYRPFIIADADTGHGGDAHIRNLIRRFVEVGVTGYHIEDQKPGTKKCGHQGGKVLVSCDEQIKRVNAARFQLDIMKVPGIIVARTDAEAASLLENMSDERDHPFVLGATNQDVPSYKTVFLALQKAMFDMGAENVKGHLLYKVPETELENATQWLEVNGILKFMQDFKEQLIGDQAHEFEPAYEKILVQFVNVWESAANVRTLGDAVADIIGKGISEGERFDLNKKEWLAYAAEASINQMLQKASELGLKNISWSCEMAKTPEGYYQIKGGIPYAITKSLAVAPYADLLWMETKTADRADAKEFADAIHKVYPDKMLAYNLSPSFNWDTTGMNDEDMKNFPSEIGKLGFVFTFITYGGHQIDGLATDEFANSLRTEGMLALAKVQRKFRMSGSPYNTPQTHVGGPRLDGALAASSGRTATTQAMGKGSTQFQHLVQIELPTKVLSGWIEKWAKDNSSTDHFTVQMKPLPTSSLIELSLFSNNTKVANIVFENITDRNQKQILMVKDQNIFRSDLEQGSFISLLYIYLFNRFNTKVVHYLSPAENNIQQFEWLQQHGILSKINTEVEQIIVGEVAEEIVTSFLNKKYAIPEPTE